VVCQGYMSTKLHGVTSSNTIFLIIVTLSESFFMNIFSSKYILLPPDFSAVPSFI